MSDIRAAYDDEIDLFTLFETLWNGKWKIIVIAVASTLIGLAVSTFKPNLYHFSTTLAPSQNSGFIKYRALNSVLNDHNLAYKVDSESVFKLVIAEFNDYDEVVDVLNKDDYVATLLQDLDAKQRSQILLNLAKSFSINPPSKNETDWTMAFQWHDADEGKVILAEVVENVLANVHKTILTDFQALVMAVESENKKNIERLTVTLSTIGEIEQHRIAKRLLFLKEQLEIARELGIETSALDSIGLMQSPTIELIQSPTIGRMQSQTNEVTLSVDDSEDLFYLRGYKAIDKEMSLLAKRTKENRLLMADGYFQTKEKLIVAKNDILAEQLRSGMTVVSFDNYKDWVNYDLALGDVKPQNKPFLYIALSLVLGGMVGAFYVLIANAVRNRKEQSATR